MSLNKLTGIAHVLRPRARRSPLDMDRTDSLFGKDDNELVIDTDFDTMSIINL